MSSTAARRIVAERAPAWRTTFVMASRTANASASSCAGDKATSGSGSRSPPSRASTARARLLRKQRAEAVDSNQLN